MPLDGVSFTDVGFKIANPSEVNLQAESKSKAEAETIIKKMDKSGKAKADPDEKHGGSDLAGHDTSEEEHEEDHEGLDEAEKKVKKYKVKLNSQTNMVELIEKTTGRVIETISPEELIKLVSKSKTAAGILVDKKV